MTTRLDHRRAILRDIDAVHALVVTSVLLLASGGLLFLAYTLRVRRVARLAPVMPPLQQTAAILLFGKFCRNGAPDDEFRARIRRAHELALTAPSLPLLLLGGGPAPTEAEVAARELRAAGLPPQVRLELEHESRDTLQNLRNARALLKERAGEEVLLVSSRYHLARCAMFAQSLGIRHRLCAAEPAWRDSPGQWLRLTGEAAYLMWIDIGLRWARLIGHQRMLQKMS